VRGARSSLMSDTISKPRLLILTPDFPPARGGIQVIAHRLAAGIESFQTNVVALDSPGGRLFDAGGELAVRRVGAARLGARERNLLLNGAGVLEAVRFRPDVTLTTHIVTSPAAAAIRYARSARTVQYFHAKEISAKPRLAAFATRQAHAVIAVSAYTQGLIAATGAPLTGLRLIPPGVDLPRDPRPQPPPAEQPTLLTISRLEDRYKGHDVMLRALALVRAEVPHATWVVIGDGPLRGELEALAASCGVADAVRFLGSVSDEQRDSWLARAHVFVMPSRLPGGSSAGEGFGIVYLEAAAHGMPVVAGNVAGALDSVADGESGLLVDPSDPHAVADAVSRVLLDRDLARRLGSAGAERAQRFAWPVIVERVEALLLEELAESPRFGARRRQAGEDSARTAA
jgi:phosphatidylinositol alpha-1,6-mannosyltransferase